MIRPLGTSAAVAGDAFVKGYVAAVKAAVEAVRPKRPGRVRQTCSAFHVNPRGRTMEAGRE